METHSAERVLEPPLRPRLFDFGVNDLPHVWDALEPMLAKACDESRGQFTIPGILSNMGLHDGVERWRLLAIERGGAVQAVMVVCITALGDGKRVLDCLLAGGENAKDWPAVDEEFDAFARSCGCVRVRIPCARKGWLKALPHWKIVGHVLEREI